MDGGGHYSRPDWTLVERFTLLVERRYILYIYYIGKYLSVKQFSRSYIRQLRSLTYNIKYIDIFSRIEKKIISDTILYPTLCSMVYILYSINSIVDINIIIMNHRVLFLNWIKKVVLHGANNIMHTHTTFALARLWSNAHAWWVYYYFRDVYHVIE